MTIPTLVIIDCIDYLTKTHACPKLIWNKLNKIWSQKQFEGA